MSGLVGLLCLVRGHTEDTDHALGRRVDAAVHPAGDLVLQVVALRLQTTSASLE